MVQDDNSPCPPTYLGAPNSDFSFPSTSGGNFVFFGGGLYNASTLYEPGCRIIMDHLTVMPGAPRATASTDPDTWPSFVELDGATVVLTAYDFKDFTYNFEGIYTTTRRPQHDS